MQKVTILESVGSCIDDYGITYPLQIDNTPDLNCGVHIDECSDEWWDNLSNDDLKLITEKKGKKLL